MLEPNVVPKLKPKIAMDATCETYCYLKPFAKKYFYDLDEHELDPTHTYIIGRSQMAKHKDRIRQAIEQQNLLVVFSNPFEGADTMRNQILDLGLEDLVLAKKLIIISGGKLPQGWTNYVLEYFLINQLEDKENRLATAQSNKIYTQLSKPFDFLFLNGRGRPHRKYLVEKLDQSGLLRRSIWSWLDPSAGASKTINLIQHGQNLMYRPREVKLLDPYYEIGRYSTNIDRVFQDTFVKYELFDNEWGDVLINPKCYIDTYFSLVTETAFDSPYSFRTEKIWKPIAMGHPWIVASHCGFYKEIKNLGFKTFSHLIDESFDSIENNQERIDRLSEVVIDLCESNLDEFVVAAKDVCKYNQQHMRVITEEIRNYFPTRLFSFLGEHNWLI